MTTIDGNVPEIMVEKVNHSDSSHHSTSDSENEVRGKIKIRKTKLSSRPDRRDSGSSVGDEEDRIILTEELKEKIVQQAEYYFSDENLKKDGFLLKHVKRNKEGFVNLKLLASFKKMRSLSRDYRVIGEALKDSSKLVVNDTGLKLKRVDSLPKELLEQVRVKHIVVSKIPNANPSMNFITEAFSNHKDDVVSVRIVKPGKKFPNDLQSHFSRHSELREECVAVVEFDNPDIAADIIKNTTFSGIYKGMEIKLLELGPKQAKKIDGESASDTPGVDSDASVSSGNMIRKTSSKKKKGGNRLLEVSGLEDNGSSYTSSSDGEFSSFSSCSKRYNRSRGSSPSTSPKMNRRFDGNNSNHSSPRISPVASPSASPKFDRKADKSPVRIGHKLSPLVSNSPQPSSEVHHKGDGNNERCGAQSPWMLRKKMQTNSTNDTESLSAGNNRHLDIVRQPRGPDGSNGFNNHPFKKYVLVHAC